MNRAKIYPLKIIYRGLITMIIVLSSPNINYALVPKIILAQWMLNRKSRGLSDLWELAPFLSEYQVPFSILGP